MRLTVIISPPVASPQFAVEPRQKNDWVRRRDSSTPCHHVPITLSPVLSFPSFSCHSFLLCHLTGRLSSLASYLSVRLSPVLPWMISGNVFPPSVFMLCFWGTRPPVVCEVLSSSLSMCHPMLIGHCFSSFSLIYSVRLFSSNSGTAEVFSISGSASHVSC